MMNLRTLNKVRRRAYRLARRKFFASTGRWTFGEVPFKKRIFTYTGIYPGMPRKFYIARDNRPFGDFYYCDSHVLIRDKYHV